MRNIKLQLKRLIAVSALSSFQLAGASWVALLAVRGFSAMQIGFAESCFHLTSVLFEIPSGVVSDVFGRRKSILLSQLMFVFSALCMAFSKGMTGVCIALALDAIGYNFSSGTREALAYDSLKAVGREESYMRFSARELGVYRLGKAAAILCAGLALKIGYRSAYLADAALALVGLTISARIQEVPAQTVSTEGTISNRILCCFRESMSFLWRNLRSMALMLVNSLAGAAALLTVFFLQSRLLRAGVQEAELGVMLFVISMGSVAGAAAAGKLACRGYGYAAATCMLGTVFGVCCCMGKNVPWMCFGGFAVSFFADFLEVRTDALLNERFPSDQRSTLLSVASLVFSLTMMALSPLAGLVFG